MVLAFYTTYLIGLVCLFAGLGYGFGLKITVLLFGVLQVGCVLLLAVLCSVPPKAQWPFHLPSLC